MRAEPDGGHTADKTDLDGGFEMKGVVFALVFTEKKSRDQRVITAWKIKDASCLDEPDFKTL